MGFDVATVARVLPDLKAVPLFDHPRLAHTVPVLEKSPTGARVLDQLADQKVHVLIVPPPGEQFPVAVRNAYANYSQSALFHPAANAVVLPESLLHPEGLKMVDRTLDGVPVPQLGVTLAHEGVHKLRMGTGAKYLDLIMNVEREQAIRAVTAEAMQGGLDSTLPSRAWRAADGVALGEEVRAYEVHSQIASELGIEGRFVNPDGSVMSSDEILDDIRKMGPYRFQAGLKQGIWVALTAQELLAKAQTPRGVSRMVSGLDSARTGVRNITDGLSTARDGLNTLRGLTGRTSAATA